METAAFIDEVAQRLVAYIASKDTDVRVNPAASLSTMRKTLDVQLPLEGHGLNAVLDDLDTFISNSVKTHRSEFMNPLWGGLSLPAFAGEVVASLTNNSMYTYELSPIATVIEQTILKRMSQMVGFPDGFGTFTTGGSNGNQRPSRWAMVARASMSSYAPRTVVAAVATTHRGRMPSCLAKAISSSSRSGRIRPSSSHWTLMMF